MNSALYGNTYPLPKSILNKINALLYTNSEYKGDGIKRAKNLIKNRNITYQQLKGLKHFFDTFDSQETSQSEYDFAGGEDMRFFVETTLERERSNSNRSAELKRPIMSFQGQKALNAMKAQDGSVDLKESVEYSDNLEKNALAIIFNKDMEVLLLKRSSYKDQWCPNKWGLVGGGVEDGEEPIDAVKREIKEETGLVINKFIEKFVIQRNEDSVEHIFIAKYNNNNDDVELSDEHQDYEWCDINSVNKMDIVPNLIEYIKIAVEKYD